MSPVELVLLAGGLAMDACAVAVVSGCSRPDLRWRDALRMALAFGLFQALMPALGWQGGSLLKDRIGAYDHWVVFILLAAIGGKMIWEGVRRRLSGQTDPGSAADPFRLATLLLLAVATSVDALAVGVSLLLVNADLLTSVAVIGGVTFVLSFASIRLGQCHGRKWARHMDIVGGIVLIGIGARILYGHLTAVAS
jgi:putative Mn2+ efflux pump MntP